MLKFNSAKTAVLMEDKKVVDQDSRTVGEVNVCVCVSASPVQVVPLHVVVLEHSEQLDVLADEAGRQQAMDPQLETLLKGERHALQTHTNHPHYPPPS